MNETKRAAPFRVMAWILGLIVLITILPLLVTFASGGIANALGCRLDEGGTYPCPWHGYDLGETLSVMSMTGWLTLALLPITFGALVLWSVVAVALLLRRWWRRRATPAV